MSKKILNDLFSDGLKEPLCERCENYTWMGQPIPLRLCFKDGNRTNVQLNNLCVLCLNCYAVFGIAK